LNLHSQVGTCLSVLPCQSAIASPLERGSLFSGVGSKRASDITYTAGLLII
jgi:hypothetical protein